MIEDKQTLTNMKIIKEGYWSVQQTQDGRGWDEIFQISQGYNQKGARILAEHEEPSMKTHPQFFRIVKEYRKVLK